jgi:hypothetical protein
MGPSAPSGAVAAPAPGLHGPSHGFQAGPPNAPGRYAVGLSTVRVVDPARADHTLTVDIWYPADRRSDAPTAPLDLVFTRLALPGVLAAARPAHRCHRADRAGDVRVHDEQLASIDVPRC